MRKRWIALVAGIVAVVGLSCWWFLPRSIPIKARFARIQVGMPLVELEEVVNGCDAAWRGANRREYLFLGEGEIIVQLKDGRVSMMSLDEQWYRSHAHTRLLLLRPWRLFVR